MSDSVPDSPSEIVTRRGSRTVALPATVLRALRRHGHGDEESFEPLAGDVGQRRYFRPSSGAGVGLLALYPASLVSAWRRFRVSGDLLAAVGIRVPEVLDAGLVPPEEVDGWQDVAAWMLVEDLGPRTVWQIHGPGFEDQEVGVEPGTEAAESLRRAVHSLAAIQSLPVPMARALSPLLDESLLRWELDITWRTFLEPRGLDRDSTLGRWLGETLEEVCGVLATEEPTVCHRDYMVRNLLPVEEGGGGDLAVLDHQDLRPGPRLYDVASLLNDSLFPSFELEEELLAVYARATVQRLDRELRDAYHRTAAQRTLKAVGTYARSGHHGKLIAPTLHRAVGHLERTPEGRRERKRLIELRERLTGLLD